MFLSVRVGCSEGAFPHGGKNKGRTAFSAEFHQFLEGMWLLEAAVSVARWLKEKLSPLTHASVLCADFLSLSSAFKQCSVVRMSSGLCLRLSWMHF